RRGDPGDSSFDPKAFLFQDTGEVLGCFELLKTQLAEAEHAIDHHLGLFLHAVDLAREIGLERGLSFGRYFLLGEGASCNQQVRKFSVHHSTPFTGASSCKYSIAAQVSQKEIVTGNGGEKSAAIRVLLRIEFGMPRPLINRREAVTLMGAAATTRALAAPASDICLLTAVEMAVLIRRKKLSASEVMGAHLKQIERVN